MESGLEDRNNSGSSADPEQISDRVSMESGLEDRNNRWLSASYGISTPGLNGVRPRRPEQCNISAAGSQCCGQVSMESGLEDRNNSATAQPRSR